MRQFSILNFKGDTMLHLFLSKLREIKKELTDIDKNLCEIEKIICKFENKKEKLLLEKDKKEDLYNNVAQKYKTFVGKALKLQ